VIAARDEACAIASNAYESMNRHVYRNADDEHWPGTRARIAVLRGVGGGREDP